MKKSLGVALILATICSNYSISQIGGDLKNKVTNSLGSKSSLLSDEEIGKGLKEALNSGIEKGVSQLSKPDGYFKDVQIKLPMPEEAKEIELRLRKIGQGKLVDDVVESMNRAAEDAANGAKDIFVTAVKNLTLKDVKTILKGNNDAATTFLSQNTRTQLFEKFKPVIQVSLDKVGATKHWETLINTYNKIPLVKKMNPDLVEYTTNKAIDGLFVQIAKEELEIRKNPKARATDILKKVFE